MSNMQISVKYCGFMYTEKRNRKDREYERLCMICGDYPQFVLRIGMFHMINRPKRLVEELL